jgi:hypothetical protein
MDLGPLCNQKPALARLLAVFQLPQPLVRLRGRHAACVAPSQSVGYRRKVRRAGALVWPDVSRAQGVMVYLPGPRKRWAGTQLRV